jgi:hypothetical protein
MSRSLRPGAIALGVAAALAFPAGALAAGHTPPNLTCDSSQPFFTGTYNNVDVPPGQSCIISNSTIRGNVTVEQTGNLDLQNAGTVGGDLLVGNLASSFEDTGWSIAGQALGNGSGGMSFEGKVHGILANKVDALDTQNATIDGSVVSNQGVFGGAIGGSVITGQLVINGSGTADSPATWVIGGTQLDGSMQQIDGNTVLTNNQAEILIFFNHIKQNLVCLGNTPAPINSVGGFGNTVDGRSVGQCATTNTGVPSASEMSAVRSAMAK